MTIIHLGKRNGSLLLLRKAEPSTYTWFERKSDGSEEPLNVTATSAEEALRLAHRTFEGFRTVICGFRYTLPERDEHGTNALFHQMVASYRSMNGVYFDEELGGNCIVHFASNEARTLMAELS